MDCNPPGSSIYGFLQARILEWEAIPLLQGIFLTQGPELMFPALQSDSLSSEPPRKTLVLVRWCSRSFKLGFSSMWTKNFQMYKLGFKKSEEPEIKLPTFVGSWRKHGNSRKTSTSASLTTLKPLIMWITTNYGKFFYLLREICMQVKKQQLEPNMEQKTDSKLGKEYIKAVYCHPAYLTYMQNISWETSGWMKHKLESRLQGEISITSDMQMTPPLWQRVKKN